MLSSKLNDFVSEGKVSSVLAQPRQHHHLRELHSHVPQRGGQLCLPGQRDDSHTHAGKRTHTHTHTQSPASTIIMSEEEGGEKEEGRSRGGKRRQ